MQFRVAKGAKALAEHKESQRKAGQLSDMEEPPKMTRVRKTLLTKLCIQ